MPVTFEKGDERLVRLVRDVIKATFADGLKGVRVDVLQAFAAKDKDGRAKGHALKRHGSPCLATVRVVPLRDRALGQGDALLTLDGDRWGGLSAARREAAVDEALSYLVPTGKADSAGRPALKVRTPDFEARGLWDVIGRRGQDAPAAVAVKAIAHEFRQREFDFGG